MSKRNSERLTQRLFDNDRQEEMISFNKSKLIKMNRLGIAKVVFSSTDMNNHVSLGKR